jgi:hypothetical protein
MTFPFAAFMVGAVASLVVPTGVFISLAIWLARSSRRFKEPVSQTPAPTRASMPAQMAAHPATAPPAQAPPPAQVPPAAQAPPAAPPDAAVVPDTPEPGLQ